MRPGGTIVWIIFGWRKIEQSLGEVGSLHCFDCQREPRWELWTVSEWVTFSDIKVFRFIHKHELQCTGCSTTLALDTADFKHIDRHMHAAGSINGTHIHSKLAARIERQQLSQKTPLQMRFIKETMKAKQEYRERMAAQEEMR